MIVEVWVVITGKGDRPFCHARRPARELLEKWHREEGGVRVLHLTANVADAGHDPKRAWATVFEEPTPADPDWEIVEHFGVDAEDSLRLLELRQAIDTHLGWPDAESEESGDYLARVVELGKLLSPHSTHGRESAEDRPNLTDCPCAGAAEQAVCAASGCGYCQIRMGPKLDSDGRPKPRYSFERHGMTRCQEDDGECDWKDCPQKRDGEPKKSGRHCPLDVSEDDEDQA